MRQKTTGARFGRLLFPFGFVVTVCVAQTHEVLVKDYQYTPAHLSIQVGDTVVWKNAEKRTSHSVIFLGRDIPESERFFPDESWTMSFSEAGEYPYRCGPHPEMRGHITVKP